MNRSVVAAVSVLACLVLAGIADAGMEEGREAYERGRYSVAIPLLRPLADNGNDEAQFLLGRIFAEGGDGIVQNRSEALRWYRKSADQGNAEAQYGLGIAYSNGLGVERNFDEAFKWLRRSAEQGHPLAAYNVGVLYGRGYGTAQDHEQAMRWYKTAAKHGYHKAYFAIGTQYEAGRGVKRDVAAAADWYREAAERGYDEAQYRLAWFYRQGIGVRQDKVKAFEWFREAAKQGHADAQYHTGLAYSLGDGTAASQAGAAAWYEKAADQGNADAQYLLAIMYAAGQGIPRDIGKARRLFEQAMARGHSDAQAALAILDRSENLDKEFDSASDGSFLAKYDWKSAYANGDFATARDALIPLAEAGNIDAQTVLGDIYDRGGGGVEKDLEEAAKWLRRAAQQGDPYAQELLGMKIIEKEGVAFDAVEAMKWLILAKNSGRENAAAVLEGLREILPPSQFAEAERWARNWIPRREADTRQRSADTAKGPQRSDKSGPRQNLWSKAYDNGDYATVIRILTPYALAGDRSAQYLLGTVYSRGGGGIRADKAEAVRWFSRAAAQGHAGAQYVLAKYSVRGEGVPRDIVEVIKWAKLAAENGNEKAAAYFEKLARLAGKELLQEASMRLRHWRQKKIAIAHQRTANGPKNLRHTPEDASQWQDWANDYKAGNYLTALRKLMPLALSGNTPAQTIVGVIFGHGGGGVERNHNAALGWLEMAAEQNDSEAQYYLTLELTRANSLTYSLPEILKWLKLSMINGNKKAIEFYNEQKHKFTDEMKRKMTTDADEWLAAHRKKH